MAGLAGFNSGIQALGLWCLLAAFTLVTRPAIGQADVWTYHNDNQRTGQNLEEKQLKPANVNRTTFGKLFSHSVDGDVYGQPLYLSNVNMGSRGIHNVCFVVTMHDGVYAFDADTNEGENAKPLWRRSYIDPDNGITTVPTADFWYDAAQPEIGILSTPVIDRGSGTLFFLVKRKEISGSTANYVQYFCAVDVSTGLDRQGSPVLVTAAVPGSGDGAGGDGMLPYNSMRQHQRAALLLHDGIVYVASASFGDLPPYHGWILGYNAKTLQQEVVFCTTPNGSAGGIWMAGAGPAVDAEGNMYVVTGNGTFQNGLNQNYGDTALKLRRNQGTLDVVDWFTPYNQESLSWADLDLGSGGVLLLPPQSGQFASQLLFGGKESTVYVLDRNNLGHYRTDNDSQIIKTFSLNGGSFGMAAYFGQKIYYHAVNDYLKAFDLKNGLVSSSPSSVGPGYFGYSGATPSISANGTNDAVVWELQVDGWPGYGPAVLHAYDARDVSIELYNSNQFADRDNPGGAIRFTVPTVANGKVYVPAHKQVSVYGNYAYVPTPVIQPSKTRFTNSVTVTISEADTNAVIHFTLDGTEPTLDSPVYDRAFELAASAAVKARAFTAENASSSLAFVTFYEVSSIGNGTGLQGEYFAQQVKTFNYPATVSRLDPLIDFNWGAASPAAGIYPANFTVRWTGLIEPQFTENYTFIAHSHSGVRVWIDENLILEQWSDAPSVDADGTIGLEAGRAYDLRVDYYQTSGGAEAKLSWYSPSTPLAVVPTSQLYPASNRYSSFAFTSLASGQSMIAGTNLVLSVTTPYFLASKVAFYSGSAKIGTSTSYPYEMIWTNVVPGVYKLTAVASDEYGTQVTTAPALVTINCPSLNVIVSGRQVSLSWKAAGPGYTVESAEQPTLSSTWRALTPTPTYTNGTATMTFAMPAERRFYRLRPTSP